jgi:MinD superfamily P-loop ATPase
MTCVHLCPYGVPQVGRNNKAEIQSVICMGCGSCAAECPAHAITLRNYLDAQVFAAVDGLLETTSRREETQARSGDYPENVGVAQPHWHRREEADGE